MVGFGSVSTGLEIGLVNRHSQKTTLRQLGINGSYCLSAAVFGVASALSFWAIQVEPESRNQLMICGGLFGLIFVLAVCWPILRLHEEAKVGCVICETKGQREAAIQFAFSRVKLWVVFIGASAFGAFGLWAVAGADSPEYRAKGAIGLVFYTMVLGVLVFNLVKWTPGVFLTSTGIDWREPFSFSGRMLIPWDKVVSVRVYQHQEQSSQVRSVGLLLRDVDAMKLKKGAMEKLRRNQAKSGFHLYCHAETLLYSLEAFARALQFYADHKEARIELADGSAASRISAELSPNPSA